MEKISDILDCGNVPQWFVVIAHIMAVLMIAIYMFDLTECILIPIMWAMICIIAIREGRMERTETILKPDGL